MHPPHRDKGEFRLIFKNEGTLMNKEFILNCDDNQSGQRNRLQSSRVNGLLTLLASS